MQPISENLLLSAGGQQEYLSVLDMMRDPYRSLVIWFLEILVDVAMNAEHNDVDIKELGSYIHRSLFKKKGLLYLYII